MILRWLTNRKERENKKNSGIFSLSDAHLLFLSGYLKPNKEFTKGNFSGHDYQEWKQVLGESPNVVFSTFKGKGFITDVGLLEKVKYTYKVSELKNLLRKYHLPVSGDKHTLASRVIEAKSIEFEKKLKNLHLYQCSEKGETLAITFLEHIKNEKSHLYRTVFELLKDKELSEAVKAVHDYETKQVFPKGMNVDWGNKLAMATDINKLRYIFDASPDQLAYLDDNVMSYLRAVASMFSLGIGNVGECGKFLPEQLNTGSQYNKIEAFLILHLNAYNKFNLEEIGRTLRYHNSSFKESPACIEITSWDSGECKLCGRIVGKYLSVEEIPDIPPAGCKFPESCRLQVGLNYDAFQSKD